MPRTVLKCAVLGIIAVAGGCSVFSDDPEYYGYEEEYTYPEPDIIPSMPDDDPGRSVDEMLDEARTPAQENAKREAAGVYEHEGRFGSKEKISLRKGLNAPVEGVAYSESSREPVSVVRPLALQKAEKAQSGGKSEAEILAEIVKPAEEPVRMVEVVPADAEKVAQPEAVTTGNADTAQEAVADNVVIEEKSFAGLADKGKSVPEPAPAPVALAAADEPLVGVSAGSRDERGGDAENEPADETVDAAALLHPVYKTENTPVKDAPLPQPVGADDDYSRQAPLSDFIAQAPAVSDVGRGEAEFDNRESAYPADAAADVYTENAPYPEEMPFTLTQPPAPASQEGLLSFEERDSFILTPPAAAPAGETEAFGEVAPDGQGGDFAEDRGIVMSQSVALIAFPANQTVLPPSSAQGIASAVGALRNQTFGRLLVVGYDAPVGKTGSPAVALRRADAVAAALIRAGVAAAQIKTEAQAIAPYGEKTGDFAEIYLEY